MTCKGKVERPFSYIRQDFFLGLSFRNLDDLNAQLSAQGSAARVSVRVEDTGLDPALALDRLRALAGEGVRVFVAVSTIWYVTFASLALVWSLMPRL